MKNALLLKNRVSFLAHSKNELMQWRGVRRLSVCLSVRLSVRLSVCKLLRKSLLLAHKRPDRHQTFTRWTPGQHASRVCSRSRSRSKVTWYAHYLGFLERATPSLTVWFTCLMGLVYESRPTCLNLMAEITMAKQLLASEPRRLPACSITFLLATVGLCCSAYATAIPLSVRPSHVCIVLVSKRLNLSSKFFHCLPRERISEIWSPCLKPYRSN